ncbi:beta-1,3-glucan-binding protein-like [Hyalella azteca]|uniref:Beta-1,3-glucan-binding protein-like n=1 Tax=Hyalella azteca TaxID=294128 RepID=A0A979FVM0_HYAAZ|nr:beta-1,3-glucan-binding protein-like [Hyalella azteca]
MVRKFGICHHRDRADATRHKLPRRLSKATSEAEGSVRLFHQPCNAGIWECQPSQIDGGNDDFGGIGNHVAASTLEWGPDNDHKFFLTHATYKTTDGSSFADNFHTWRMEWTPDSATFYLDEKQVLRVDPGTSLWDLSGLANSDLVNPWRDGTKMAPFDTEFYLIVSLAVGGVNGYFPDGLSGSPPKPWSNYTFRPQKGQWLPSWQNGEPGISESAALQVDYIKVWKMS